MSPDSKNSGKSPLIPLCKGGERSVGVFVAAPFTGAPAGIKPAPTKDLHSLLTLQPSAFRHKPFYVLFGTLLPRGGACAACRELLGACRKPLGACRTILSSCRAFLRSCREQLGNRRALLVSCIIPLRSCRKLLGTCRTLLTSRRTLLDSCKPVLDSCRELLGTCRELLNACMELHSGTLINMDSYAAQRRVRERKVRAYILFSFQKRGTRQWTPTKNRHSLLNFSLQPSAISSGVSHLPSALTTPSFQRC